MDITVQDEMLLMCKDIPVYNVTKAEVLREDLLPGAMLRGTLSYTEWMRSRYSAGSNVSARRLMLRAFATDNHRLVLKATRALSLSDCYWLKEKNEQVLFNSVTPYLNKSWNGSEVFEGGSIATLFVNGNANKYWADSKTLVKVGSVNEIDPFLLCGELGLAKYRAKAWLSGSDLHVENFTTENLFFESMEQSGFVGEDEDARFKAVEMFKEQAVALFVLDYLVECDDRHWGNFGFIRDSSTGAYLSMAPYYDFDWLWTGDSVALPANALDGYAPYIRRLCGKALGAAERFAKCEIIMRRAGELLSN